MIFITEILLKVALNAIALTNPKNSVKNQLTEESIIMIALSYRTTVYFVVCRFYSQDNHQNKDHQYNTVICYTLLNGKLQVIMKLQTTKYFHIPVLVLQKKSLNCDGHQFLQCLLFKINKVYTPLTLYPIVRVNTFQCL